ncbi:MAG: prenyltransferase/squalene oxidase repeat-containing protein [Candidatus Helarchaeota archaeon]
MKSKHIFVIGLIIGLFSFTVINTTIIYSSNAQIVFNFDDFKFETDPNIVTRRSMIFHFLRLNFWVAGMKGFSDGLDGRVELSKTYEGVAATTYILGQWDGISLDFFFGPTASFIESHWNITLKAYGASNRYDVDLYSTYYAVAILDLIGRGADSDIVNYVDSLQNDDGGFGSRENETSSITATYYAILLLKKFGRLDLLDNATDWIVQTQNLVEGSDNYGAFSSNKSDPTYTIFSTYEALAGLCYANGSLANFPGLNLTAAALWIVNLQNLELINGHISDYGGFSDVNDIKSSLPATRAAVAALNLLGALGMIKSLELLIWVFSCQPLLYGGFANSPSTTISSVSATYNALEILRIYKWPMLLLFTEVPWVLEAGLPWYGYLFIILIVIATSLIILYFVWKRLRR